MFIAIGVQAQDGKKIDDLAKHIISSLKKLDTSDVQTFRNILISSKEINDFIASTDMDEDEKREIMENINEGQYDEEVERAFGYLVMETRRSGINWSKIEYEDMLYKLQLRDGVKQLRGEIYFQEGDVHYEMGIMAGKVNDAFVLFELRNLRDPRWRREYEDFDEAAAEAEAEELIRQMEEAMEMAVEEEADEYYEEDYEEFEAIDEDGEEVYSMLEHPAEFPGGEEALTKWINQNIQYPEQAVYDNASGKVFLEFVVEKDGTLTYFTVVNSVHEALEEEAIRLLMEMPKWTPGTVEGSPVRSWVTLPITFELK